MNFISSLILLLGFVAHCWCAQCTDDDLGSPVPAEICNPANCVQLTRKQLITLGSQPVKAFIWNILARSYVGYCPHIYNLNITQSACDPSKLDIVLDLNRYFGPNCSLSSIVTLQYTAQEDSNGKITILTHVQNGSNSTWEICFPLYDETTGTRVYRSCRVDPPPPPGSGFGSVIVQLSASLYCPSQEFVDFINNSGVDWGETVNECSL